MLGTNDAIWPIPNFPSLPYKKTTIALSILSLVDLALWSFYSDNTYFEISLILPALTALILIYDGAKYLLYKHQNSGTLSEQF